MKFKSAKWQVMCLGANKNCCHGLGHHQLEMNEKEKDLGIVGSHGVTISQDFVATEKGNTVLGCIRKSISSRERQIFVLTYQALVRPHLQYCNSSQPCSRKVN